MQIWINLDSQREENAIMDEFRYWEGIQCGCEIIKIWWGLNDFMVCYIAVV